MNGKRFWQTIKGVLVTFILLNFDYLPLSSKNNFKCFKK